jgi:N utilization substance protein B
MEQLNRSELRVKIMTILYQISIYEKNKIDYKLDDIFKEVLEIDNEFVKETVYGVITYKDEIDKIANENMNDWTIDRLGYTDQAILRMGIFELLYTQTPDIVAINEAVELAKQYSDEKVKNMINGVMDNILHNK